MNARTETGGLVELLDAALTEVAGQPLISQSRCVDWLLDLFNLTEEAGLRDVVSECLAEIRHLNAVRGQDMQAALMLISTAAAIEMVFVTA